MTGGRSPNLRLNISQKYPDKSERATSEATCVSLPYVHQRLAKRLCVCVCVCVCDVCEAVGEVRGCEGEGYPTASERKREKRGRELSLSLHVEGKKRRDEKMEGGRVALFS